MRIPVALALSIALLAREVPASAAAPDLSEARKRFVAAVQASDKDVAAAEAALEELIRKASPLLTGSDQKKLDDMQKANGQVTRPAGQASLHGTIVITSTANASVRLTLEGDATLTAGGSGNAWASLPGHGTARLSGFGASLTILNATVESQGPALTLRGGDVSVRGCAHTVQAGSRLSGSELSLAGSLRCGSWTVASSTLKLEGGGVSGNGTFSAWSRSFSMSYSASGGDVRATLDIPGTIEVSVPPSSTVPVPLPRTFP